MTISTMPESISFSASPEQAARVAVRSEVVMRWSPTSAEGQNHARGSASGRAAGPASERGEVPFLRSGADQRLGMSNQAHSGDSCLLPRTDCGCRNLCHQAVFMNHASGAVAALDPELIEVGDATGATPSPRPPSATCGPRPGPWPSLPPRSPRPWPVGPTTCATRRFPSGWRGRCPPAPGGRASGAQRRSATPRLRQVPRAAHAPSHPGSDLPASLMTAIDLRATPQIPAIDLP